ncbi:cell wall metabolism sensor histidine kinase WalK [Nocardioides sp. cx-173]|uniref:sensor histidine kinase n=1 Tax=Nocardioides sp. cx-173 TaxID=2898796 RepID=UPI001E57E478|nr:HAMP domain-containing sensor histidine kinase [Nocardioides sp. cx-173]MCD4527252.1 HAMP domain-containing histidine kinase [Nocardioides sp. cx-173]UGB40371.1 HAMP domain-containing histidine kinase [Nocardioides sp. cx-173]
MTGTTTPAAAVATTTEPPAPAGPRPRRSGVSVRVRITAAVAALVLLALSVAGAIVYVIESQRLEQQTVDAVEQELDEFAAFTQSRGRGVTEVGSLLRAFMAGSVPDDDELLVGWVGDRPTQQFPRDDPLPRDAAFQTAAAPLVRDGGSTRLDTAEGEVLVTAQPVVLGEQRGALVVVVQLDEGRGGLRDTMRTYAIVAALSLLLVTAAAFWQAGRLLAPLRVLRESAEAIGETDLSRRVPESGNDDITALTHTVNGMLERLEAAFVGQRRFLDDAGHELRTPLTVLRGHLELLDTGDPEEVAETRALLLDEVDRMSRLVGDLILLAKSDRPDFVTPAEVDLEHLTEDVLAKARALGDREWLLDATAAVTMHLDGQRLTQALLQLADNAVKHTAPGDVVAIGSSYDSGTARLWVRDTGPGVAPEDREAIFERFGRGRVAEHDEGFGLGLSIVRAIAQAHGGDVAVEDAQPRGARFVITLPGPASAAAPTVVLEEEPWPAS